MMRTKRQRINDLADEMEGQEWTFGQILEHINRGLSQRQHIERRQLASFLGKHKRFERVQTYYAPGTDYVVSVWTVRD